MNEADRLPPTSRNRRIRLLIKYVLNPCQIHVELSSRCIDTIDNFLIKSNSIADLLYVVEKQVRVIIIVLPPELVEESVLESAMWLANTVRIIHWISAMNAMTVATKCLQKV